MYNILLCSVQFLINHETDLPASHARHSRAIKGFTLFFIKYNLRFFFKR